MDCPPFRVLTNDALLILANSPDMELHQVRGLASEIARQAGDRIHEAIHRGMCGRGVSGPPQPKNNPWEPEAQARLQSLKLWRSRQAASLGLDPALVWPAPSLERLALSWNGSTAESPDVGAPEVRSWQRHEFSQELRQALVQAFGWDKSGLA